MKKIKNMKVSRHIPLLLLTGKTAHQNPGPSFQIGVTLKGPQLVKRYDTMNLNCSSDILPIDSAANIKINNGYYTSIRIVDGKCYSTDQESECLPGICNCSEENHWFSHFYKAAEPESVVDISCSMTFGIKGTFSSSIQVTIIDFSGPEITTNLAFPIPAGSEVNLSCSVGDTKRNTIFIWNCLNNKTVTSSIIFEDEKKFTSILTEIFHVYHDGITCTCTANVDGYIATTSMRLEISKKPNLQLEESVLCNSSFVAILSCVISTELSIYGFTSWIHYNQGILIRTLNGQTVGNQSILTIEPCRYQDTGEYTCNAWNFYDGNRVFANETITLFVKSAPVVISKSIAQTPNGSSLFIWFYSPSDPTTIWTYQNRYITNSTQIEQNLGRRLIKIQFYNISIDCDGYIASILVPSTIHGHFAVLLRNEFSETRETFQVKLTKSKDLIASFDFRSLIFGISAFGIFIATTAGAAILVKERRNPNVVYIVSPLETSTIPIYHCAPSTEPVVHIYDTANSRYLEVVDNDYLYQQMEASGVIHKESDEISTTSATTTVHNYEEID